MNDRFFSVLERLRSLAHSIDWSAKEEDWILETVYDPAARAFFFQQLNSCDHLRRLAQLGFFSSRLMTALGAPSSHRWQAVPEITALARLSVMCGDLCAEIGSMVPETHNPFVCEDLLTVAQRSSLRDLTNRFLPLAIRFVQRGGRIRPEVIVNLASHWCKVGAEEACRELLREAAAFHARAPIRADTVGPSPQSDDALTIREVPVPRIAAWEYVRVLNGGYKVFLQQKPLEGLEDLLENLHKYLLIRCGAEAQDGYDGSEFWCSHLSSDLTDREPERALVSAAVHASCRILRFVPERWQGAIRLLRARSWLLFKRILWHTCSQLPEAAKSTIGEELLIQIPKHMNYQFEAEFVQMVQNTINALGDLPLQGDTRDGFFNMLRQEPNRADLHGFDGQPLNDQQFQFRRKRLLYRRIKPFESVLPSDLLALLSTVDTGEGQLSPSDYRAIQGDGMVRTVESRSPVKVEDLKAKGNDQLAELCNTWTAPAHGPERSDWWVEIGVGALAGAFAEVIRADPDRFTCWDGWWHALRRPVFHRRALGVAIEQAKARTIDWNQWLCVSEWVLSQPVESPDSTGKSHEESFEYPNWNGARRAVGELLDVAFSQEANLPLMFREQAFKMLATLCCGPDPSLDKWRDGDERDPLQRAINTTRGRALETLADFGWWIRQWGESETPVDEIWPILESRIEPSNQDVAPIFAIIAMNLPRFCGLNREWVDRRRDWLFPRDNPALWRASWHSFVRYTHAWNDLFAVLREEYRHAVSLVPGDDDSDARSGDIANPPDEALGGHLMTLYWRGVLALDDPLMAQFFERASERTRASVAQMAIHALRKTESVPPEVLARFQRFFEWRLSAAPVPDVKSISEHPWSGLELIEYGDWLECDKFPAEWRLRQLEALLNRAQVFPSSQFDIASLIPLLPDHLAPVTKCLHLFVSRLPAGDFHYWKTAEMRTLLRAAIQSEDAAIKRLGEEARDLLLKRGLFDFMELDDPPDGKKSPSNP